MVKYNSGSVDVLEFQGSVVVEKPNRNFSFRTDDTKILITLEYY